MSRVGSGLTCPWADGSGRVGSGQLKVTHVQLWIFIFVCELVSVYNIIILEVPYAQPIKLL